MATKIFASRAFLTINGFESLHLKSCNLKVAEGLARVSTMTRDRSDAGYKYANRSIQIAAVFEIEDARAQIDPAIADPTKEIGMVFECGGERYVAGGIKAGDMGIDSSVGDASKSINFEALTLVNENGVAVNTDISLS